MRLTLSATTLVRQRQLRLVNNIQTDKWANRRTDGETGGRTDRAICLYVSCIFLHSQLLISKRVCGTAIRTAIRMNISYVLRAVEMTPFCRCVERSSPARFTYRNAPTTVAFQWRQLQWTMTHVGPATLSLSLSIALKLPKILMKSVVCVARSQRSLFRVS